MGRRKERELVAKRNIVLINTIPQRLEAVDEEENGIDGIIARPTPIGEAGKSRRGQVLSHTQVGVGFREIKAQIIAILRDDIAYRIGRVIAGSDESESEYDIRVELNAILYRGGIKLILTLQ